MRPWLLPLSVASAVSIVTLGASASLGEQQTPNPLVGLPAVSRAENTLFQGGQAGQPSRTKTCSQHCERVDGKAVAVTTCHPYIDPAALPKRPHATGRRLHRETDATTADAIVSPAARERATRHDTPVVLALSQSCAISAPMTLIKNTSPNCWVSDDRYCRKPQAGRTGFSCSCGSLSGYYG